MEVALQQFLRLPRLPVPPLRLITSGGRTSASHAFLLYAKVGDDARATQFEDFGIFPSLGYDWILHTLANQISIYQVLKKV